MTQQATCYWGAVTEHCLCCWYQEASGEVVLSADQAWLLAQNRYSPSLSIFVKLRLVLFKQTPDLQPQIVLDVCWGSHDLRLVQHIVCSHTITLRVMQLLAGQVTLARSP